MMYAIFAAWLSICALVVSTGIDERPVARPPAPQVAPPAMPLQSDETVIVFPSRVVREQPAAAGNAGDGAGESPEWVIHLRGWVFEREADSRWRNAAIDKLGEEMGLTKEEIRSEIFRGRARSFLCDNERGKRIGIEVAGRTFVMPETSEDGHFEGVIRLTDTELKAAVGDAGEGEGRAEKGGADASRRVEFKLQNAGKAEVIAAAARVVEPAGMLVVCDIDDTIKVSNIGDRKKLLRATFVEPFVAVPGMSDLCTRFADAGAEFHYLSASPWQLYEPLAEFLRDNEFPEGGITLREFRMKDERILNVFENPGEYKLAELAKLAAEFPKRRFMLVGDSTEHDAELYVRFAKDNPGRVAMILIRGTPGDQKGKARAQEVLKGMPGGARWVYFEDPASARLDIPELRQPGHEPPR